MAKVFLKLRNIGLILKYRTITRPAANNTAKLFAGRSSVRNTSFPATCGTWEAKRKFAAWSKVWFTTRGDSWSTGRILSRPRANCAKKVSG